MVSKHTICDAPHTLTNRMARKAFQAKSQRFEITRRGNNRMVNANKLRTMKPCVWEVKARTASAALAQEVITKLGIIADVAKLRAMVSKIYIPKSKGFYAD